MMTLPEITNKLPIAEVADFNQHSRDRWVYDKSQTTPKGAKVLDIGAGTCPYRKFFSHCDYKSQDFKKYEGPKLWGAKDYGQIDYESDIIDIPVESSSFDIILCTEVLEHVPEPILAMKEMARIVKPSGRLFVTAPLLMGLHQLPYHFYSGYTPEWYKLMAKKFGLEVKDITPNGGYFKFLSQECGRFKYSMNKHAHLHGEYKAALEYLFGEWLPRYLFDLDGKLLIEEFTVGYFVEFVKKDDGSFTHADDSSWGKSINYSNVSALLDEAEKFFADGYNEKAKRLALAAYSIDPKSIRSKKLLEKIK
ncbi:MAG TPA: class I SAM-dependent methyltransferase [Ignavibacteriales bacterium]|nr:class I SAM-dependent methyltransferase [Ignavibacteriales bacterium]